nr:IS21 family transposase [uncultured Prevotella sp.]
MSLIKQVLQLKQLGESNRGIAKKLPINKETVNSYMSKVESNKWKIDELLQVDDLELERMFHAGSPAYTDVRKQDFLSMLPYIKEQLSDPKNHVTRQVLYDEYKQKFPNGYGQSQFYHHLKQNLVAKKDVVAVLSNTYKPGEKLMVDFAGDKLGYVNVETGEMVKVEVFVATMPYSDYTYVVCVPSQKTEDFPYAIRMCLEHLGGVPPILTPDNLKSAVISNDRHEPKLNKALEDMGNYYHFVVLPCDPVSPTQKALVEDAVRISYSRIHAKLRNRTFYSLLELNQAVWELMEKHNQTRMQKRPYSHEYVKLIFDPQRTNQPEEIYYKLCDSIISLKRKYELDVFNLTCRQCIEYKVFSYRQFEAILKRNQLYAASEESVNMTAPTPTSHGNMRGKGYFAKTSV